MVTVTLDRSPRRHASGATEAVPEPGASCCERWKSPKKNSLFLTIGPPNVPPKMCCVRSCFGAFDRLFSHVFASKSLLR
jgi:hypothetical protein